jgi:aminoglycoside 3-N-acetyltransferase
MTEHDVVEGSAQPVTVESRADELRALGIREGDVVIAHASLGALGWVCGGAVAVIEALLLAVGPRGTLAMPAHSTDLSEPSNWVNPPVPQSWWPRIRAAMPAFDPRRTPTRGIGAVAELFRTWPGVLRSEHPTSSFAAFGARAELVVAGHPLEDPMGEQSPLGRLYDLDARIALLGVGHDKNTSLHLAERKAFGPRQSRTMTGSPLMQDGKRRWVEYGEPASSSDDFVEIGTAFGEGPDVVRESNGIRVMRQRQLVDFAVGWLAAHRRRDGSLQTPE